MTRAAFILSGPRSRQQVTNLVAKAPAGTRVEVLGPQRSTPQNARMWVLLTAVSGQKTWFGQKYSPEEWKDYFMHEYRGEKWMPREDGGMVPIGRSTSRLSVEEHSELTTLIEAFCARQGIAIEQPAPAEPEAA